MRLQLLGSGTSTGVPIVGCPCPVCTSDEPRNRRLRSSATLTLDSGHVLLIDTSPDLRQQALLHHVVRVDAVLYTHTHADHVHGIDEIRIYNYLMFQPMEIYGAAEHLGHIRSHFDYIFNSGGQVGGGKPLIQPVEIVPGVPFTLYGQTILPVPLLHGALLSVGWRVGRLAYLTDVNQIPDSTWPLLDGVEIVVLGALRWTRHTTHFTIEEAVKTLERMGAKHGILTHMGHEVDYETTRKRLPDWIEPGYDGMVITL